MLRNAVSARTSNEPTDAKSTHIRCYAQCGKWLDYPTMNPRMPKAHTFALTHNAAIIQQWTPCHQKHTHSLSRTIRKMTRFVMYHPCHTIPVHSRAFPFILRPSFMFPLFSVSVLLRSVPLSVTFSHFYFRLRPWWAQSPDGALNSVGLYFTLLLFMSPYTSVPFPLTPSLLSTFVFLR